MALIKYTYVELNMSVQKFSTTKFRQLKQNYLTIDSETLRLIKDSDAIAIWIYLLDQPNDWTPNAKDIENRFNISKTRVEAGLKILRNLKLIEGVATNV